MQRQRLQIPQPFEMNQTDVGDIGLNQRQALDGVEAAKMTQPRVGDFGMADLELLQARQVVQDFQQRIGKDASLELHGLDRSRVVHDDVRPGARDRQKGRALCRIRLFGQPLVPKSGTGRGILRLAGNRP